MSPLGQIGFVKIDLASFSSLLQDVLKPSGDRDESD